MEMLSPPPPAEDLIFSRSRSACLPTAAVFEVTEVAELNLLDKAPLRRAPLPTGTCDAGTEEGAVDWTDVSRGDCVVSDGVSVGAGCGCPGPESPVSPGLLFLFLIEANNAAPRPPTPRPAGGGAPAPPPAAPSMLEEESDNKK